MKNVFDAKLQIVKRDDKTITVKWESTKKEEIILIDASLIETGNVFGMVLL